MEQYLLWIRDFGSFGTLMAWVLWTSWKREERLAQIINESIVALSKKVEDLDDSSRDRHQDGRDYISEKFDGVHRALDR